MSGPSPITREWFTTSELAALALPGLPRAKRKLNELAAERGWGEAADTAGRPLARPRVGRGGGMEYHRGLLPPAASLALIRAGEATPTLASTENPLSSVSEPSPRDQAWAWFEAQADAVRGEARRRLAAVDAVEALEGAGLTRSAGVAATAAQHAISPATLWSWLRLLGGVERADRLPALAPRRRGGGAVAEIDPDAWRAFVSDYLRPEKPTLAACYGRLKRTAPGRGWGALPHLKTFQRRLAKELDPRAVTLAREGVDALRRTLPPQQRSVADLHALEHVNIDGHKWDVFVRWPPCSQHPGGHVARPMMVAIQDLYSRKCLAWRIAETESALDVRLAFADLFKTFGIPAACTLDNGRGFASKWITGGTANRFRFKVQPGDPAGLLTALGVRIHWTLPYRGQSKPIERMFRDFCGRIATHPAFAGAYVGNKPDAKPENYGSHAVPLADFRRVVAAEIKAHNERTGRDTEMARGVLSFDQVFEASYATSPIRRASPEQLRLALLAADKVRADPKSGAVRVHGNSYWAEDCLHLAGQALVARFDPDDLQSEVHLYDLDGRYRLTAPVWRATGFVDVEAAKARARLEARHKRAARDHLAAEHRLEAHQLAALLPEAPEPEPMVPRVVRPVRVAGGAAAALRLEDQAEPARAAVIDRFIAGASRLRLVE